MSEIKKIRFFGHYVTYTNDSREGIRYLREDLSYGEARVFFDQAKFRGSAQFEDDQDRQFTLTYDRKKSFYNLTRR